MSVRGFSEDLFLIWKTVRNKVKSGEGGLFLDLNSITARYLSVNLLLLGLHNIIPKTPERLSNFVLSFSLISRQGHGRGRRCGVRTKLKAACHFEATFEIVRGRAGEDRGVHCITERGRDLQI